MNCLIVFDHFVKLTLKGLNYTESQIVSFRKVRNEITHQPDRQLKTIWAWDSNELKIL